MTRVEISEVNGALPIEVYASDYYGNNREFVGTIVSPVPPSVFFDLSSTFDDTPMVKLILIDINGCEYNQNIDCTL